MSQRYYAEKKMQEDLAHQLRQFKQGNGTMPLDWLQYSHILPYATYAGRVGPAGGYADFLVQQPNAYSMAGGDQQMQSMFSSPWYWAAVGAIAYLYLR